MAILKTLYKTPLLLLSILLSALLSSCYSDFDPGFDSTPVICMNGFIVPGDTVHVSVTRSWQYDEGVPGLYGFDITLDDAEVEMIVNDSYHEKLVLVEIKDPGLAIPVIGNPSFTNPHNFISEYLPKSGDRIKLIARHEKYGVAEAEVTVPYPVEIEDCDVTVLRCDNNSEGGMESYNMDLSMKIWFEDNPDDSNYYQFDVSRSSYIYAFNQDDMKTTSESVNYTLYDMDFSLEPLFKEHISVLESVVSENSGYAFFSDRQINGERYPIHFAIHNLNYAYENPYDSEAVGNGGLDLSLAALSPEYYKHILSVWVGNNGISGILGDIGLGNAVFPASNVSTGAGIVVASAPYIYRLKLRDIARNYLFGEKSESN